VKVAKLLRIKLVRHRSQGERNNRIVDADSVVPNTQHKSKSITHSIANVDVCPITNQSLDSFDVILPSR